MNAKSLLEAIGISPSMYDSIKPMSLDEYRQWQCDEENKLHGDLTGYDCPECLNRGYFAAVDHGYRVIRECRCMAIRRNAKRLENSGLKDMIRRYTFDTWETPDEWQKRAADIAKQFVSERSGWFLCAGHSGSGKTHLCTAICGELMEAGLDVRYMLWRDIAVRAKAMVNDEDGYENLVSPLKRVRVLYIDDLFKTGKGQEPTTADVNLAFEILNSRYNDDQKITIISTERTVSELLDIDEAVGSRIYEKSKGYRLNFADKPNWRLK